MPREHRTDLEQNFEDTMSSLGKFMTLSAGEGDAFARAEAVAAALTGVVHSSDTDCDYYPCVLTGPDPTSDAFFAALGISRDERADVSGWDNPKLDVARAGAGEGERPAIALLTRLGDHELGQIGEYVEAGDLAAMQRAIGVLEAEGRIVSLAPLIVSPHGDRSAKACQEAGTCCRLANISGRSGGRPHLERAETLRARR